MFQEILTEKTFNFFTTENTENTELFKTQIIKNNKLFLIKQKSRKRISFVF